MKELSFEQLGPEQPKPPVVQPEEQWYQSRLKRDRATTAIPDILWRTAERLGETASPEAEMEIRGDAETVAESLDTRMLRLYALAQEYSLKPATGSALRASEKTAALAVLSEMPDKAFLENMEALLAAPPASEQRESEVGSDGEGLEQAIQKHRFRIREEILSIMRDPILRQRYQVERKSERKIRLIPKFKTQLKEVLKLQALRTGLTEERRRLRVSEFLARESTESGRARPKEAGLTPVALQNIERGVTLTEKKEETLVKKLTMPERGLLVAEQLLARKQELEEKGFVVSPSRERLISEIVELTAQGYRVFLGGPTGAGKTSIALFALKEMTGGSYSWITWTGETTVRDLFGSPKFTATQAAEGGIKMESGMTKGPVTRAVLGERSGVLHEEITAGQTGVQMSMKTLWASKPGEQVNLPGFNGSEFTKAQLIEIATGNLKGRRHQEREAMDPAVAREYKAMEVSFMPAEETRDYLILPMLIDRSGVMPVSRKDVDMVTAFCRAAELSQLAHLGEIPEEVRRSDVYKTISPSGESVALTSVFLDTGTVKDLFSGWRASGKPFSRYLEEGLKRFIDQNPYFRENIIERDTMKNILCAYGLDTDARPVQFFRTGATGAEAERPYLRPSELGFLIPASKPEETDEFAGMGSKGKTNTGVPETKPEVPIPAPETVKENFGGFLKRSYKESWSGTDEQVAKVGEKPEIKTPESIDWEAVAGDVGASKFGEFTVNPDTVGIQWETIPPEKIKVFEFTEFRGKKRWELAKYITTQWPDRDKYHIPGIEYWKYVFENPDKAPASLKDGNWHCFFGTIFRGSGGSWGVPLVSWVASASEFGRHGGWLASDWHSSLRVVLLEK